MSTITVPPAGSAVAERPAPAHRPGGRLDSLRLLSYVLMVAVVLIYLYPIAYLVNTALKSDSEFIANPNGIVRHPMVSNFVTAWRQGNFGASVLNSVLYTAVAAGLGTVTSLMIAFPVARGYLKHSKLWAGLFAAMMFLPNTLVTLFQLALHLHLYDTRLGYMLILASGVGVGPLLITGYLGSIPREIDEAAAMDGAGYLRYLLTFLPTLLRPVLSTTFILQAIGVWNDIILATILFTDKSKFPVTLGLFAFKGTYVSQWSLLSAATLIVATPLLIVYVFLQRYLVASVVGGAVKG